MPSGTNESGTNKQPSHIKSKENRMIIKESILSGQTVLLRVEYGAKYSHDQTDREK